MTSAISTSTFLHANLPSLLDIEKQLTKAETESTSGRLADVGLTLGSQTGYDISLRGQTDILTAIKTSNTQVGSNLTATQNSLKSIAGDAQSFLNSLVSATGGTSPDLSTLQSQAQTFLANLTSQLNSTANGSYLFGGINSGVKPVQDYVQTPASAAQTAVATAFSTAFPSVTQNTSNENTIDSTSLGTFLNGPFATLFNTTNWQTNWSSASSSLQQVSVSSNQTASVGLSANDPAFAQLANAYVAISDLGLSNLTADSASTLINYATTNLSSAVSSLTTLQSNLGVTQSQITTASSNIDLQLSVINNNVSNLEKVDPAEAATRLTNLQTQLETAYSLTGKISKLSLVDYL